MALQGAKLAGGNPKDKRVENDYYATNPLAVEMLLKQYDISKYFNSGDKVKILEPCVGEGHICKGLFNYLKNTNMNYLKQVELTSLDIVDRGFKNTIVNDYLQWHTNQKFDFIITNPPYSLAQEFCEHGIDMLSSNGCMAMFMKIQFLKSAKRKEFFKKFPPKYIYVFGDRMATWNNGQPVDKDGKRWATTFLHAWFIWEKDSKTEPIIRWIYKE